MEMRLGGADEAEVGGVSDRLLWVGGRGTDSSCQHGNTSNSIQHEFQLEPTCSSFLSAVAGDGCFVCFFFSLRPLPEGAGLDRDCVAVETAGASLETYSFLSYLLRINCSTALIQIQPVR